jgi:hypothetical protein
MPYGGGKVKKPSRFLLFMLAFLPGLGHMYLGLMRRGIFFLSAFAFSIFVTVQLGIMGIAPFIVLGAFSIVAAVVIPFFEALSLRRGIVAGIKPEDCIPAFAKSPLVLVIVAFFLIVPFVVNILSALPWFVWLILLIVLAAAFGWFNKKPKE